ncbi:MAG TPA: hypothetical protein VEI06_01355 [Gemmatimonadaceae bacterium]|nr:hypothetical protein [Gemmatimonadaceae bacterium]
MTTGAKERRDSWMRRRARNVYRRPVLLVAVGSGAFALWVIALVQIPRSVRRAALAMVPTAAERPDTVAMARQRDRAVAELAAGEGRLARARAVAVARARAGVAPTGALTRREMERRDSLQAAAAQLERLRSRAAAAPLPTSYRALAESTVLRGDPNVTALVDSLAALERQRGQTGVTGGVDSAFVAITARLNDVGAAIEQAAVAKRESIVAEESAITPSSRSRAPSAAPAVDTAQLLAARDSLERRRSDAEDRLATGRATMRTLDAREAQARDAAAAAFAPAPVLLAAAGVLAVATAFLAALGVELRTPRVSGAREAASVAGVPVLLTVQRRRAGPERSRREADLELPHIIDQAPENYRFLFSQLASRGLDLPRAALAGDDAAVTAMVAINLAAAAAREARTTLLIDSDFDTHAVSSALRLPVTPGVAEVVAGGVRWPETLIPTIVGRGRAMDIMPAGVAELPDLSEVADTFAGELEHIARRYDTVILNAPAGRRTTGWIVGARVAPVIVCVHSAHTPIAVLRALDLALSARDARIRGLVVWDAEPPDVPLVGMDMGRSGATSDRPDAAQRGTTA